MARRSWVRVLAAAVAGALALVAGVVGSGLAGADAVDAAPQMTVQFGEHQLFMGQDGDVLVYRWKLPAGGTAHDVRFTVDLSGVAGFAEPESTEHCKDNLCTRDLASVSKSDFHGFRLLPKPGAAVGVSGKVTVSGTASDATVTGDTLTLTNGRTQLGVNESAERSGQKPGDELTYPITVWNYGQLPAAKGVQLRIDTTAGLLFRNSWANCRDVPRVPASRASRVVHETLCDIPVPVEPGKKYALSAPLHVRVGDEALEDLLVYGVTPLTGAPAANGPGAALTLVPDGSEPGDGNSDQAGRPGEQHIDSSFMAYVNSNNHADFGVTGDSVTGRRGGHATLHTTVAAHGPAVVEDLQDFDEALFVEVKLPPGTTATQVPHNCYPPPTDDGSDPGPRLGRSSYWCSFGDLVPGNEWPLEFTVAIGACTSAVSTGSIKTRGDMTGLDRVVSNDRAALTLKLTQDGSGSGGTSCGSGSGSVSGSGPLADTGVGGGWIVWAAGALVLAGGVAVTLSRRSRWGAASGT